MRLHRELHNSIKYQFVNKSILKKTDLVSHPSPPIQVSLDELASGGGARYKASMIFLFPVGVQKEICSLLEF